MSKASAYTQLEKLMVTYRDLKSCATKENNEPFVALDERVIPNSYQARLIDMKGVVGERIWVRKTVSDKLNEAQSVLKSINQKLSLYICYGYRTLEIQTMRFLKQLKEREYSFFSEPVDLYEEMHRFVAVPTVAGHPTGAAIDVYITDNQKPLDFGTSIYDYRSKDCYVFSPFISERAQENRELLRKIMMSAGFAPFDGEWWHFSYGDREWAYYYNQPAAIYTQISLADFKKMAIQYNK